MSFIALCKLSRHYIQNYRKWLKPVVNQFCQSSECRGHASFMILTGVHANRTVVNMPMLSRTRVLLSWMKTLYCKKKNNEIKREIFFVVFFRHFFAFFTFLYLWPTKEFEIISEICRNYLTENVCARVFVVLLYVMKRKSKQWWSTISPVSTQRTITSHLNSKQHCDWRQLSGFLLVLRFSPPIKLTTTI
jgi:hypothetical protein